MNFFRTVIYVGIIFLSSHSSSYAEVKVLLEENFDTPGKLTSGLGIGYQAGGLVETSFLDEDQINVTTSEGVLKAVYPVSKGGGIYGWASFDMTPYNTYEVYVEFHARMPKEKQGIKFLKIFGGANTTFGLDYTGISSGKGSLYQVSFGDGTTTQNDTQNVINLNGNNPSWIGRSYGKAVVNTPEKKGFTAADWGDKWHHFRFKVKFNSAIKNSDNTYTEINDGEYYVEIDGKVYVDATGLLNRHPTNGPITKVALLDWAQNVDKSFEIYYDNLKITTGGFDGTGPSGPKDFKRQ
ncbi:hypothetical protein [Cellvibrio sp. UBA7661]|uniref:hypothetical protein n=1 Tax=Cellvibrio sp. UBA7661 TaxID=1946311 RepID=UPI002F35FC69